MEAKHFDEGKPDVTQLPWGALKQVALVMMNGEKKYGKWNFMKGMHWTKLVGSTLRHCYKWLAGEDNDDESGQPHLAHAAADLLMLLAIIDARRGTDDRYRDERDLYEVYAPGNYGHEGINNGDSKITVTSNSGAPVSWADGSWLIAGKDF